MKNQIRRLLQLSGVFAGLLLTGVCHAHPGHGLVEEGPVHQATSAQHFLSFTGMLVLAAGIAAGAGLAWWATRRGETLDG